MIKTGKNKDYFWIEVVSEKLYMDEIIVNFPEFFINKYLAIISFDSDSFIPTESELSRGWIYENEIAYFDGLTEFELAQDSLFDIYDQWLLFDNEKRINEMETFVNYSNFFIDIHDKNDSIELATTLKFWEQIEEIQPQKFILNGGKLIFGTSNEKEFRNLKNHLIFSG